MTTGADQVARRLDSVVVVSSTGAAITPGTSGNVIATDFGETVPSGSAAFTAETVNSAVAPFERLVNVNEVDVAAAVIVRPLLSSFMM